MNISENILKHNLENVYFITGTSCAGKTTMCKELANKYGFTYFNSNHRDAGFASWTEICDIQYQKVSAQKITDWEYFFNRQTEEYLEWLNQVSSEYLEYGLIEIIKLAQVNTVVTDVQISINFLKQISSYNRIACLITSPELWRKIFTTEMTIGIFMNVLCLYKIRSSRWKTTKRFCELLARKYLMKF